jgi:hypothetical protein
MANLETVNYALVVPGFGGGYVLPAHENAVDDLRNFGVEAEVHDPDWHSGLTGDEIKQNFYKRIREKAEETGQPIDLYATSAAAALTVIALAEEPTLISGAVLFSGRVNDSDKEGLAKATAMSSGFGELLPHAQRLWTEVEPATRKKVITARPRSGDRLVPEHASKLRGARTIVFAYDAIDHHDGIGYGLTEGLGRVVKALAKVEARANL